MIVNYQTSCSTLTLNNASLGGAGAGPQIILTPNWNTNFANNSRTVYLKRAWLGVRSDVGSVTVLDDIQATMTVTLETGTLANSNVNATVSAGTGAPVYNSIQIQIGQYPERWEPICPIENLSSIVVTTIKLNFAAAIALGDQVTVFLYLDLGI
jgi:hypothetical protein